MARFRRDAYWVLIRRRPSAIGWAPLPNVWRCALRFGRLSPDEQWLAYVSDESGRDEIYVRPFPALDRRVIVSTNGGDEPVWSHDGRELFYLEDTRMMAVTIETAPGFEPGLPKILFEHDWMQRASFDVAADGRFVMIRDETPPATSIEVVLNWTQQLEAVR